MIEKIVSGGQTGVDQAALEMASKVDLPIGGWCPQGGLDENGNNILKNYALKEANTSNPDERTKLNIEDSDGTLIIVPEYPLPKSISDGTLLTIKHAAQQNKPHLVVALSQKANATEKILNWIYQNNILVLNIGGPRESSWPGINKEASLLFEELFRALQVQYQIKI
jgi:Circularly permutated YpsA SLOG family